MNISQVIYVYNKLQEQNPTMFPKPLGRQEITTMRPRLALVKKLKVRPASMSDFKYDGDDWLKENIVEFFEHILHIAEV